MKSLALRAFALLALGWLAHSIKPFTSENLTTYAATTTHSFVNWLPETAVTRWEKTAVLAAALGKAWHDESLSAVQPTLAANLQPNQPSQIKRAADSGFVAKSNLRRKALQMRNLPVAAEDDEATATDDSIASSAEETFDTSVSHSTGATLPLPITAESGKAFLLPSQKRAACTMPSASDAPPVPTRETELEAAPAVEIEIVPLVETSRPRRQINPLEIETQPVRFIFKRAPKTASQC